MEGLPKAAKWTSLDFAGIELLKLQTQKNSHPNLEKNWHLYFSATCSFIFQSLSSKSGLIRYISFKSSINWFEICKACGARTSEIAEVFLFLAFFYLIGSCQTICFSVTQVRPNSCSYSTTTLGHYLLPHNDSMFYFFPTLSFLSLYCRTREQPSPDIKIQCAIPMKTNGCQP